MKKWTFLLSLLLILSLCGFQTPSPRYTCAEITTIGCGGIEEGALTDDPATLMQLQKMVDRFQNKVTKGSEDVPAGGIAVVIKLETIYGRIQQVVFIADGRWVTLDGEAYACTQSDYRAALKLAQSAPAQKELAYWRYLDENYEEGSHGFLSAPGAAAELRVLAGGLKQSPLNYNPSRDAPDGDPMFHGKHYVVNYYGSDGFSTYRFFPGAVLKLNADGSEQVLTLTSVQYRQVVKLLGAGPLAIPTPKSITVSGLEAGSRVITDPARIRAILDPLRDAPRAAEQGGGFCGTGAYQIELDSGVSYTVYDSNDLWIYDSATGTLYHNPKGSHSAWRKALG